MGLDVPLDTRSIVLPVGISFFTFMGIAYVVDVYRRDFAPVGLGTFAAYLSFFPHLVAGPIVRPGELIPQLSTPRDPRYVDTSRAFFLIGTGLFMKVVIANHLAANIVDQVFGAPNQHSSLEVLVGIYAYAVQIYSDFFGYTNIAIGIALLLGFAFPQNFDAPYSATSITDFWRRWHMTLSRWLRDYLYIPLGGNRGGSLATYRNLMLTMLIGGLWHGAGWTFVVVGRNPRDGARRRALVARAPGLRRAAVDARAARLASLRHVPGRLLRLDLLPGGLVRRRLVAHPAPVHRVGRALAPRHLGSARRHRSRHRLAVPPAPSPARDHGAVLAPPDSCAGHRPRARTPRHPRHGPRGRGTVHLLPVLMDTPPTRDPRRRRPRPRTGEGGRRLHSAGSAVVVSLAGLAVGVLLNAPGLHKSATIQPQGWKRDLALDVTGPLDSVSGALLLDQPRRALKAALGRSRDDDVDTAVAATTTPATTPVTAPAGPAKRTKFTPKRKLGVYIAGDSLVVVPGESLLRATAGNRAIAPTLRMACVH